MQDFETVDFFTDISLNDDPHAYFDFLRGKGPVVKLPHRNVYAVTGYEEALQVYKDIEHFSSANAVLGPIPDLPFKVEGDDIVDQIAAHRDVMPFAREIVTLDAPDHGPLRSLLMPLFTPRRLKALEEGFRRVADQIIDEFADQGGVELINGYGTPFATLVITELLGIPESDRALFRAAATAGPPGAINGTPDEMAKNPLVARGKLIAAYLADRRATPRDDLLSELANAKFPDGSQPSLQQATSVSTFLFSAGQDTTAKLLGNCFRVIAGRQDLQQALRDQPERIPDFVEEVLRFEGSVKSSSRLVKRSTTLGGVDIAAGATILLSNLGVNRDPARFEQADQFRLDRPRNKEHLAFGRGGHTCPGAPLARLEVLISIERLLSRLDNIRFDEAAHGQGGDLRFSYEPTYILRALKRLDLCFDPKGG